MHIHTYTQKQTLSLNSCQFKWVSTILPFKEILAHFPPHKSVALNLIKY